MKKSSGYLHKHKALTLLLFLAVLYSLLVPIQTLAQSKSTSLSNFLASRVNRGQASFTYSPAHPKVGQAVQFVDNSTNNPTSWHWDFGDGTTSTVENPSHYFAAPGFRKVTLTASNSSGTRLRSRTITVISATSTGTFSSAASFSYTPSFPVAGQAVQFTDTSTNSPTSWQWHFGDGMTSTSENPSHPYGAAGTYTVTLDASNSSGTKTASQTLTVSAAPTLSASFTFSPASPAAGQAVQFKDTSTGSPTSWLWNFGDGTTSTSQNPSHAYTTAGAYAVTLIATNSSASKSVSQTVTVVAALAASFTFSPTSPSAGQAIQFTDTSTGSPTSWQWNFGDGSTSTAQNPSHTFSTAGSYTVTLTVSNSSGSKSVSQTVTVIAALTASFSYTPTSPTAGQAVQFTDTSTGSPTSWQWDFGDTTSSTTQNPSHTYAATGSYLVTLTIRSGSKLNNTSKTITVGQSLTASFTYSPTSPAVGQAVQFTDTSTGSPTSRQWNFGDGSTSTVQNPSHTFTTAGSYSVTLTVINTSGSKSVSRTLTVSVALTASFTYSPASPIADQAVQFTDTSTGSPTSWQWNFGDGSTSTVQNPSHTFTAVSSYTVILTVSSSSGSNSSSKTVSVLPSSALTASFTYSPASPITDQAVQFTDTSTGSPTSWQWNFGDGSTSAVQNPSHTFTAVSSYTVTLTIGNSSGSSSANQSVAVSSESDLFTLPNDRKIDWSKAGVWYGGAKGIPTYPVGITINTDTPSNQYYCDPSGTTDCTTKLRAALAACPAGYAVLIPTAGTYRVSGTLSIRSGVVLRGPTTSGAPTAIIKNYSNNLLFSFQGGSNDVVTNITAGYAKGSSTVTVASSSGFAVGDLVLIDQDNDPSLVSNSGSEGTCTWCGRNNGTRSVGEIKTITAINGNTITIDRPLYWNFSLTYNPQMVRKATASTKIKNAGLEYLGITASTSQTDGGFVDFRYAEYCWVQKCNIYNCYGQDCVALSYYSKGCEIRDNYIHDTPTGYFHSSAGYALDIYAWTTDNLIENNIIENVHSPCTIGSMGGAGNVIGYNWLRYGTHDPNPNWWMKSSGTHGCHTYMNLFEGNVIEKVGLDNTWGSGSHNVLFRNHITGDNRGRTQELSVVYVNALNYYHSFVANILSHSGASGLYETANNLDKYAIWCLGWDGFADTIDSRVASTIIRHGNYDYVTKTTKWESAYSIHAFPNSYYLTSKPVWFGTLEWPAIGSDISGYVKDTPAAKRWATYLISLDVGDLFR
jgi:PKD repeat protein